ncbi:MAG: DMT family transporter [Rhodospirillales bacterium]|nr:DMT family transporter [Rhodospirillales bacterium]
MSIDGDTGPALLAVLSAFLFALSMQIQNLGLQNADPRTAALVSILATATVYWLASPLYLESAYWLTAGTLYFAGVGLFRPALSASLAITSIKVMGPSLTSGLAATNPLFAAGFAIILLGEGITTSIALGTCAVVAGVATASYKPGGVKRGWPLWAILLPLGAAFFRALGHPLTMIGMETAPSPLYVGLVSYTVSSIIAFSAYKLEGRKIPRMNRGYAWFAVAGILNGTSIYSLNSALQGGKLLTIAPIVACSPIFTIALGYLVFKRETITWQTAITIALVVLGIILIVAGDKWI